jgi:hypothetical protein
MKTLKHNLYASSNIIRLMKSRCMRWVGYVRGIREIRNAYSVLVIKPQGKSPLGRARYKCMDYSIG